MYVIELGNYDQNLLYHKPDTSEIIFKTFFKYRS